MLLVGVDFSHVKHELNYSLKATSFRQFEKGEKLHDMLEGFLGTGIFNSDDDVWKFVSAFLVDKAFENELGQAPDSS